MFASSRVWTVAAATIGLVIAGTPAAQAATWTITRDPGQVSYDNGPGSLKATKYYGTECIRARLMRNGATIAATTRCVNGTNDSITFWQDDDGLPAKLYYCRTNTELGPVISCSDPKDVTL